MHTSNPDTLRSASTTELVAAIASGDPNAWDEVISRYGRMVDAKIRSFRLQEADALDARQATWLLLLQHAGRLHTPEHLGGWLATVASRECLAIIRLRRDSASADDDAVNRVADPTPGPEDRLVDAETQHIVWDAVDELAPRRRTLLRGLFAEAPVPYAELADECGIPLGSIGPTRKRALADLRHSLDDLLSA